MAVVRFQWAVGGIGTGGPGLMTFHHEIPDPTPAGGNNGAVLAQHAFLTAIRTYLADDVLFTPPTFAVIPQPAAGVPDQEVEVSTAPGIVRGTNVAEMLPAALQYCLSWRTAVRARWALGRTFIPGAVETDAVGPNLITTATLDGIQAAANDFIGATDIGAPLVVYSRSRNVGTPVQSARIRRSFAVLRSRRD